MARKFSQRSLDNLKGVHPDLVRVVTRALQTSPVDFTVLEGRRTLERQKELFKQGASKTLDSRHIQGMAVDLLPINPSTGKGEFDWDLYHKLAPAVKEAAKAENVPIVWGGDWKSFMDGPHFELPKSVYPNGMKWDLPVPPSPVEDIDVLEEAVADLLVEYTEKLTNLLRKENV
jgi:peptidoglycan L-alanyl-D-glutamate endopeptidase CwlK